MSKVVDELLIKKGTVIHINGFPFELKNSTIVLGQEENLKLARFEVTGTKLIKKDK